jgi:alkylhydroperoxidase/carboxymuconolactone decarboxylase family protein YurZ
MEGIIAAAVEGAAEGTSVQTTAFLKYFGRVPAAVTGSQALYRIEIVF